MKSIVLFINLLVFSMACAADSLKDAVAGKVELAKLRSTNWFQFTVTYECELKLMVGKKDVNHEEVLEKKFNCFTYDGSTFSEPDVPSPKLNAVFFCAPLKGAQVSCSDIAFFDAAADVVLYELEGVKSMKTLLKMIPYMMRRSCEGEDDDSEEYWYSWVQLGEDGKLKVYHLEASTEGKEFSLWLYKGVCKVKK